MPALRVLPCMQSMVGSAVCRITLDDPLKCYVLCGMSDV